MISWATKPGFGRAVNLISALHLALAFVFFPIVPFLGWLNSGRSGWIDWIPDLIMLQLLPAAYFVYWHTALLLALPAIAGSWLLCYRTQGDRGCWLLPANLTALILYTAIRLTLFFLGVQPDSV